MRAGDKEVFEVARRARDLTAELKRVDTAKSTEGGQRVLERVESFKGDVVGLRAVQGIKVREQSHRSISLCRAWLT